MMIVKKSKFVKKVKDSPGYNNSFMTTPNLKWFHLIMNWLPDPTKPLVLLPCGKASRTRGIDGRKYISKSVTHDFLRAVSKNKSYERIIVSEPLILIPYSLESHPDRPDYNLPVRDLSIQSEIIFIHQLSLWFLKVKLLQPERQVIYYVGGKHHYFVIKYALELAGNPFKFVYVVPKHGIKDYAESAQLLDTYIQSYEKSGIIPNLELVPIDTHQKQRGRYSTLNFWHQIHLLRKDQASTLDVCPSNSYKQGFSSLYDLTQVNFKQAPKISDFITS